MALLRRSSKGTKVEEVQAMLNRVRAKPTLTVDGQFGPKTEAAVAYFQAKKSLDVDGMVGPKTLSALKRASGGPGPVDSGDLAERFETAHEALRKRLIQIGNLMFIVMERLDNAPASCRRLGTEPFLGMISELERMIAKGRAAEAKRRGFADEHAADGKAFAGVLAKDPVKAKKLLDALAAREKAAEKVLVEFDRDTARWPPLDREISEALRAKRKGRDDPEERDPKLEKAFEKLHAELRKELKSNAHVMFITLESLKGAPSICERIGEERFTAMIPKLERMLKRGAAVARKNKDFLRLLEEDAKEFEKELERDPERARKRLLVVRNKKKQIDELDSEFHRATEGFRQMYAEIRSAAIESRA